MNIILITLIKQNILHFFRYWTQSDIVYDIIEVIHYRFTDVHKNICIYIQETICSETQYGNIW